MKFILGIIVGAALSNTEYLSNMCMIAIIKMIDSVYYSSIFIGEYIETEELWRLSFLGLKVIQFIQVAITFECGDYLATMN